MKMIGYGAIAHDVTEDQIEVEVVFYPLVSGTIELPKKPSDVKEETSAILDAANNIVAGSVKKSQTLTARWLAEGSARVNMPSLKQGEQVTVYQHGDTDRYYFKLGHLEKDLRRKEVGVFSFSNKPDSEDEFGESFDKDSSYTLTVDPKNKLVELHTAMNDGEPASYTIKLDTAKAVFSILDSYGNSIKLDSTLGELTIDVPKLVWNGESMSMNGSGSISLNSPKVIIKGVSLIVKSSVKFFKSCVHRASVTFNGLSVTKPNNGHVHTLE